MQRSRMRRRLHPQVFAVPAEDRACVRAAKADRRLDERRQDLREIERRFADRLKHARGRGLLLERLLRLVEEAHVLDRDDRLIGERLDELDLLLVKWRRCDLANDDRPDGLALANERCRKKSAVTHRKRPAARAREAFSFWPQEISDMHRALLEESRCGDRGRFDRECVRHRTPGDRTVMCGDRELITLREAHGHVVSAREPRGILGDRVEHRLKFGG